MTNAPDLDPLLVEILACPRCHASLTLRQQNTQLACDDVTCGLVYPIRDGIPVLLIDEAIKAGSDANGEQ